MRLSTVRRAYQAFFLTLYLLLLAATSYYGMRGMSVDAFLLFDPLLALTSILSGGMLAAGMAFSLIVVAITLVFGRVFCGWICPMGTLNQLVGRLFGDRSRRRLRRVNRWRPWYRLRYLILVSLLVGAVCGVNLTGWMDPLALLTRSLSTGIFPAAGAFSSIYIRARAYQGGWIVALLFVIILAAGVVIPRLWCRAFCPLGALLGLTARFPWVRIRRDDGMCTGCMECVIHCQGADEPCGDHRPQECHVCLNCTDACPEGAISWRFFPRDDPGTPTSLARRELIRAGIAGFAAAWAVRATAGGLLFPSRKRIRPPGARGEEQFVDLCVRCGECMKVCPTNALHPAWSEAGVEGFWSPVLVPRLGYCEYNCNLCGKVCPTSAIEPFSIEEKIRRPIVIGLAMIDRGRCLPWANDRLCTVCEEMCPTDPKAIEFDRVRVTGPEGERDILRPRVLLSRCIGCGICENKCPVVADPAIYVISSGESRDPSNTVIGARA